MSKFVSQDNLQKFANSLYTKLVSRLANKADTITRTTSDGFNQGGTIATKGIFVKAQDVADDAWSRFMEHNLLTPVFPLGEFGLTTADVDAFEKGLLNVRIQMDMQIKDNNDDYNLNTTMQPFTSVLLSDRYLFFSLSHSEAFPIAPLASTKIDFDDFTSLLPLASIYTFPFTNELPRYALRTPIFTTNVGGHINASGEWEDFGWFLLTDSYVVWLGSIFAFTRFRDAAEVQIMIANAITQFLKDGTYTDAIAQYHGFADVSQMAESMQQILA